jgi:hypothetical protein
MQNYVIFVDDMTDGSYQIALCPSSPSSSSMGTKQYTKEGLIADLRQYLGYTDGKIARFFAEPNGHQTLLNHPLSDEAAAYFGWLPEYNKR